MSLLAACSLALFAATAPQQPPVIEVIGPARPPSDALRTQVEKGEDDLLLFDIGYGVHDAVAGLHAEWALVESRRANSMREALATMQVRCAPRNDAAAKPSRCSSGARPCPRS